MSGEDETMPSASAYALAIARKGDVQAPDLPYRPRDPVKYRPRIGLIGAGGITSAHLEAYRSAGYDVAVICDRELGRAIARRDEYFPSAEVTDDAEAVLRDESIEVVDIATHPSVRVALIESALGRGKHVLSQKPFVLDLDIGEALVERADRNKVKLAVNQNGRWAPHLAYMREAVRAGLIGQVQSVHIGIHWDHGWTKGTPFEDIDDLVFYDFAIHWFDFLATIAGDRARVVHASRARALGQESKNPLLAQAMVELENGQASLVFDGYSKFSPLDTTYISGTNGALCSVGPSLDEQMVTLETADGVARPHLVGTWFNDGFHGAMGELLCAIEEDRQPSNGARENMQSLALCFAAIEASHTGRSVRVGTARKLYNT